MPYSTGEKANAIHDNEIKIVVIELRFMVILRFLCLYSNNYSAQYPLFCKNFITIESIFSFEDRRLLWFEPYDTMVCMF
jgi:hypothetical protein